MCGHVGVFKTKYNVNIVKHKDIFSTMLYADYVRGKDSTGVAVVHSNRTDAGGELSEYIYKRALPSYDFLFTPGFAKAESFTRPVLMLGHNRAATRGSVCNTNAHPFEVGKIILAHNGTLTNKLQLPDSKHFDTDSECIAHLLDTRPIEEAINLLEGAWALVWWNKEEKTLNFLRNKERDFYYCTIEDGDTLLYSSTEHLLRWTVEHNKSMIDGESTTAYGTVTNTKVHHLYTFAEGETEPTVTEIKIKPKQVISYPKKSRSRGTYQGGGTTRKSTRANVARRKKIIGTLLDGMQGQVVPFKKTSSHVYTNKTKDEKGMYVMGRLLQSWSDRVFPEFVGTECLVQSTCDLTPQEVHSAIAEVWAGTFTGYTLSDSGDRVTLALSKVSPFPMYDVEADLKRLEEEKVPAKKLDVVEGPGGLLIPYTDFRLMVTSGCAGCRRELSRMDAPGIVWVENDYPVCPDCVDQGKDELIRNNAHEFGFKAFMESYI